MEHHHYSGPGAALLSTISAIIAWISLKEAQVAIAIAASIMAIISGFLAARYYWYATKEKKQNLRKR